MNPNRINKALTAEELAAATSLFDQLEQKLAFLVDLSPDERQSLVKMGAGSQQFVRTAAEVAEQNIDILPRNLDPADLRTDVTLYDQALGLRARATRLREKLDDTAMLAGSEAMAGALVVYSSIQRSGRGSALDQSLDDLGRRFRRKSQGDNKPANL